MLLLHTMPGRPPNHLWVLRRRMNIEERFLMEHFGEQYCSYAARTSRLVPGVY